VRVWDTSTGKELVRAEGQRSGTVYQGIAAVAFSPDGRWVASTRGHRKVKVWDATTGQEALALDGDTTKVTSVAFSPDGRRLAVAGVDRVVRLWDVGDLLRPKADK